ncbi:hypothetical protein LDENG_00191410 [Lucifuga dentata]|nr:hypothetical protein LDENG_00191410 [Lucifuga dentata]
MSSDAEQPDEPNPSALLTQKMDLVSAPPGDFNLQDLYRKQWKQVQNLANSFWKRWMALSSVEIEVSPLLT